MANVIFDHVVKKFGDVVAVNDLKKKRNRRVRKYMTCLSQWVGQMRPTSRSTF